MKISHSDKVLPPSLGGFGQKVNPQTVDQVSNAKPAWFAVCGYLLAEEGGAVTLDDLAKLGLCGRSLEAEMLWLSPVVEAMCAAKLICKSGEALGPGSELLRLCRLAVSAEASAG